MTGNNPLWPCSRSTPELSDQEVHLWSLHLDVNQEAAGHYRETLAADERRRADQFLQDGPRLRFTACRGQVRAILGRYLGMEPAELRFGYGPFGKPHLESPGNSPLRFNVSHCRPWAILAVAAHREIGIDLEELRPISDLAGVVRQCLAPNEQVVWKSLAPEDRLPAFLRAWTAKEAVLKLLGRGLSLALNRVEVLVPGAQIAGNVEVDGAVEAIADCSIQELIPAPGYVGALALPYPAARIACWHWSP